LRLFRTGGMLLALAAATLGSGQTVANESARSAIREAAAAQRAAVAPMMETAQRQRSATAAAMQQAAAQQRATAVRINVSPLTLGDSYQPLRSWFASPIAASGSAGVSCEPLGLDQLNPVVERVAALQGMNPEVVRAVIAQESGFRPCAVSPKGAIGLMQLMPATIEDLEVRDPFDPGQNIGAGTRLLRRLLDRYGGDLALALAAYNAGPARVDDADGIPPISETTRYVSDLLKKLNQRAPATTAPAPR
jgi:soluble lytic murein transglycosylase-like protein